MKRSHAAMAVRTIYAVFLMVLFYPCASVRAVLVERDWLAPGDALLTYDTDTGLEWLDVTATADQSYNTVNAMLGQGGQYEGFAFASEQQVLALFHSGGLLDVFDSTTAPEEVLKIEAFLRYWGVTWYLGTGQRTEFLISDTEGLAPGQHWAGRLLWFPPGTAAYTAKFNGLDDNEHFPRFGSALVRSAGAVTLDGDVNEDGAFNAGDLLIMVNVVLGHPVDSGVEPGHGDFYPADSSDGIINLSDLLVMWKMLP